VRKILVTLSIAFVVLNYSMYALAGTPQTTMECQSVSGNATITGFPEGEGFDLKIKVDNATIRYTNVCDDTECAQKDNYGMLTVVDALYNHVFTISFANSENNNRGMFYALPNTTKYKKNSRGYTAEYKGIYWGDDPRSNESFKAFVKDPGIEFNCKQENTL
jgi:hypothetical protein